MLDHNGCFVAGAYGLVPAAACPLQSSRDWEDYALFMAASVAMAPIVFFVDCKDTLACIHGGRPVATAAANPRAHLWQRYMTAFEDEDVRAVKTLAHASRADVQAGRTTEWERFGNSMADELAKKGAQLHGLTEEHDGIIDGCALLTKELC